jgi:uncharacterized protein (DUF983 family)
MGMKGNMLLSIFRMKCPRCHDDNLFEDNNPYNFSKIFDMPERCSSCGQKFEMEPGFFYGAMYVSYGVSIAFLVSVYVSMLILYPHFSLTEYLVIAISSLFVLTPYFFRLSRSIWIHLFVKYDPDAIHNHKDKA